MFDFKKITGLATAAVLASAVAVQASPWVIDGASPWKLPGVPPGPVFGTPYSIHLAFNPAHPDNIPAGIGIGTEVSIGTLRLAVDAVSLTFAYLGKEAGATNAAFSFGGSEALFNNTGTAIIVAPSTGEVDAGVLNFKVTTNLGGGAGGSIDNLTGAKTKTGNNPLPQLAFYLPNPDSARVYWFFDDGGHADSRYNVKNCLSGDCDFDDMWGYIDAVLPEVVPEITPVPLPAAGFLLLGGLGGLGLLARRRRA